MDSGRDKACPQDRADNERIVDELIAKNFGPLSINRDGATAAVEEEDQEKRQQTGSGDKKCDADKDDRSDSEGDDEGQEPPTVDELDRVRTEVLAMKESGNAAFRKGDFEESVKIYTSASRLCKYKELHAERAVLYSNRAASELKMNHPKAAIHSASRAIKFNPGFVKAYLRRAKAHEQDDKLDESLEDYKKVLELDPAASATTRRDVSEAILDLERRIQVRNENMKEEMMSKLKDLGNLVLRPFGLSTNNFQMAQDPNTGGYSINFKQNSN